MKFFTGFIVGTVSGITLQLFQSNKAIPVFYDTKIFHNIKDIKDLVADLQKNSAVVPEVVSGIQNDLTNYTKSIKPDVEELQNSIQDLKENLDEFNKN